MGNKKFFIALFYFLSFSTSAQTGNALVKKVMKEMGGKEQFYNLKTVSYTLDYYNVNSETQYMSNEVYEFKTEKSYGNYSSYPVFKRKGRVIQAHDGNQVRVSFGEKRIEDKLPIEAAYYMRKANYYWFTMFFKLFDPGVHLIYYAREKIEGINYYLVKVSFGKNVGDAQDNFILYINPNTFLVDQFLFTIRFLDNSKVYLMQLEYEEIDGLKLPTQRRFTRSNWEGMVENPRWSIITWSEIQFGIKVPKVFFQLENRKFGN